MNKIKVILTEESSQFFHFLIHNCEKGNYKIPTIITRHWKNKGLNHIYIEFDRDFFKVKIQIWYQSGKKYEYILNCDLTGVSINEYFLIPKNWWIFKKLLESKINYFFN